MLELPETRDLKNLTPDRLDELCQGLRTAIIEQVASTGGHLSSNLGVVELTVALHMVYDSSKDRLVFDVGHQCYTHKLLTGRHKRFDTLRQLDGIAGFPKPSESVHDAAIAGHASNSISVALGMARARTALGGDYDVVAIIGDGSLTGGMAYEALSDAGHSGEPLVVILNDNEMSITRNVGGVARYLSRLRVRPSYLKLKKTYHTLMRVLPGGKALDKMLYTMKTVVKDAVFHSSLFESLGFMYLGPTDGYNIDTLVRVLKYARDQRKPVLLHVNTIKGKGCSYAERNPSSYHGVSGFDLKTGRLPDAAECFSSVMGKTVTELARQDGRICAVTAAMGDATGLEPFMKSFPARFFDVGIAEQHAVGMAAGMAKQGLKPLCAIYSTFLQRAFDQMIHDVALDRLPVVFAIDRAGLVGADGETHHGLFDASYLCMIPGLTVLSPASFAELRDALQWAFKQNVPVAVRYPRGGQGAYTGSNSAPAIILDGSDVTLLSYGVTVNNALDAAKLLAEKRISARVVKLNCLSELNPGVIAPLLTSRVLMIEESCQCGGVSERLTAALSAWRTSQLARKQTAPVLHTAMLTAGSGVVTHGSVDQLQARLGLGAQGICNAALELTGVLNG